MIRDTIAALATAPGRAAIAVVRLSGPQTRRILNALDARSLRPRRLSLKRLKAASGEPLDEALVVWLPGPASYTGEDSAELHLHGGRAIIDAVLSALTEFGTRLAEPGEFTRRAFENGRLDLTQAEAIADLVDAETEGQRRQALAQLDGELGRRYRAWRETLADCMALLEAEIDFPDEDLPERLAARVASPINQLVEQLVGALAQSDRGALIRDGWRVALIGAPNAGKSSLFNALLARDAAIVTPMAGTTRDVLEAAFDLSGYKVTLADTAGLRETQDLVESEGMRRARAWASEAAMRCWVVDAAAASLVLEDAELLRAGDLLVLAKADLPSGPAAEAARRRAQALGMEAITVSVTGDAGLGLLRERLTQRVIVDLSGAEFPAATRERHRQRLQEALTCAQRARNALAAGPELAAEDLRLAARALAAVVGQLDAEAVLDRVFASFCIGK